MYQYKILKWLIDHFSGMVFLGSLVFLISNIEMENLVCKMSILNVWKYFREDFRDKKGRGFEPIFKNKNLRKKFGLTTLLALHLVLILIYLGVGVEKLAILFAWSLQNHKPIMISSCFVDLHTISSRWGLLNFFLIFHNNGIFSFKIII